MGDKTMGVAMQMQPGCSSDLFINSFTFFVLLAPPVWFRSVLSFLVGSAVTNETVAICQVNERDRSSSIGQLLTSHVSAPSERRLLLLVHQLTDPQSQSANVSLRK